GVDVGGIDSVVDSTVGANGGDAGRWDWAVNHRDARISELEETVLPEDRAVIGVDRVKAAMLGGGVGDIVKALGPGACGIDANLHQRLGVHLPVKCRGELLAEGVGIYIGGGQRGFDKILAGVERIGAIRKDIDGEESAWFEQLDPASIQNLQSWAIFRWYK